jgi:hypothetical protein
LTLRGWDACTFTVVTLDPHVERVRLLFTVLAPRLVPVILGPHAELLAAEQAALAAHESDARRRITSR